MVDVLEEMERKELDLLAVLDYSWDKDVSLDILRQKNKRLTERYNIARNCNVYYYTKKANGKTFFLVSGQEIEIPLLSHQEWNFHFLSIGVRGIRSRYSEDVIEEITERGGIPIWDHSFAGRQERFKDISSQKEAELVCLLEKGKGKVVVEWNGHCLPWVRFLLSGRYGNVNAKIEKLADRLNIPVVPTTDTHACNKRLMKDMGTCRIKIPACDIKTPIIKSLRENILAFNFKPCKGYVSFLHFIEGFGMLQLKEMRKLEVKEK